MKEFLATLQQFQIISEDFRRLPTIPEDRQRFPRTNEKVRLLSKMFEEPSKQLTVFFSKTVNIKKIGQFNSKHLKLWANNTKH